MTEGNTPTTEGNKATVAAFLDSLNQGVLDGSEGWAAYLSPQVIDHNKIIFGEGSHARMPEPTGRSCDVEQIWIFTVTGELITEIRAVSDRLGMFLQLGWDWPAVD